MNKRSAFFNPVSTSLFLMTLSVSNALADNFEDKGFVTDCIKEYVIQFGKIGSTATEKAAIHEGTEKIKQKCIRSKFLKEWDKIGEETDADPLLNAQDYQESWKTQVRIENFGKKDSSAKLYLGQGSEEYCLRVTLKKSRPHWKIDSSRPCSKN
jgi:hypothetical protein